MAVKDESLYHATESFILPCPRKQYRAFMSAGHWQLRSFISSPGLGKIHYLGGRDVYEIDTSKQSRQIVDTLPFPPRCLTSANGWICCGGDSGKFAVIHLDSSESNTGSTNEADDRLPLDLDPFRRLHLSLQSRESRSRTGADVPRYSSQIRVIGVQIINCVTLWFPGPDSAEGAYTHPVAVIASNDCCVYIVNLETLEILQSVELVEPINLGRISRDGSVLIAVGDDPYMNIYKRILKGGHSKSEGKYSWSKCNVVQLPGQHTGDQDEMRGSFAGDFSDRYLAVGTQYGMVAVFETSHLTQSETPRPIITFPTTRPGTKSGAVRSLQFSPSSPYDLLAVTEDGGRVIIADVRSLDTRQVIDTDPNAAGLQVITPAESTCDHLIDPRLQADLDATDNESTDSSLVGGQRRTLSRLNHDNHQPTRDETDVLEVLQVERRRREREANSNASSGPWSNVADELLARARAGDRRSPGPPRDLLSSRNNDSLRAFILERNQEREQRGLPPRRRGFVVTDRSAQEPDARDRLILNPPTDGETLPRISLHLPSSLGIHSSSNSWAEIEAINNMAIDPPDSTARMLVEVDDEARRDIIRQADELATIRRRQNEAWSAPMDLSSGSPIRARYLGQRGAPDMMQTTGCSWSRDSRTLYVGTEGGIYEYRVNITNRKIFPNIKWR